MILNAAAERFLQQQLLLTAMAHAFILVLLIGLFHTHKQLPNSGIYKNFPADLALPLATKSLMLEFCFTHPDSIRMLFPGGNIIPIQSISGSQGGRMKERRGES